MKKSIIITIILVIAVGAGGFFAGMKYQESKRSAFSRQPGTGQGPRGTMGFRPVSGEIIGSDDKSITVKLPDGSSKIILLAEKTEINKADKANRDELKVGEKVAVFGTENADGSITAQNIQLNPIPRGAPGGGSTRANPNVKSASDTNESDIKVKTIAIEAGSFYYNPREIRVKKGEKIKIVLTSKDMMHDFTIDELNVKSPLTKAGETSTVEFVADKNGEFEYYCSVAQHRKMGQVGKIIVE